MKIVKAVKFRIYPDDKQLKKINDTLNCCRFIYNHMLERNIKAYRRRKAHLSCNEMQNLLPVMKGYLPWLAEADSQALQHACRQLDDAYNRFFNGVSCFPRFKKKYRWKRSYTTTNKKTIAVLPAEGMLKLPCLGMVRASGFRTMEPDAKVCKATISKEPDGRYYCSVSYSIEKTVCPVPITKDGAIGLDFKVTGLYVDDKGNEACSPPKMERLQKQLKHQQRNCRG